jgi:hypothetical protein
MNKFTMTKYLFVLICLAVCGCTAPRTYVQAHASRQDGKAAKVACDSSHAHKVLNGLDQKVFIAAVDGKSTFTLGGALTDTAPYAESAYVTPGRHYLDLEYTYLNSFAWGKVWFDAEGGGSYMIRHKASGYELFFWVEDLATGKAVGGIPGGEPPSDQQPAKQSPPI